MVGSERGRGRAFALAGMICALVAVPARAFDEATANRVLQFAQQRLAQTASQIPTNQYPKSSLPNGTWRLIPATDMIGWTQGFFPGELWLMYQQTGDATWRTRADAWTRNLELQKTNMQTHDLGFKFMPSFGLAYQATGDEYYRQVLLTAAGSLASRYHPQLGIISCCDWNPDWDLPLVIDTMVNLELLLWGAQNGGQSGWRTMALNHALRTLSDLVRPNGSTYHVANYDSDTGALLFRGTYQGYSNSSTWARGQAWAVYGFTMVYRYTRDPRMLEAAQKVTDIYLSRLPADAVPYWDFDAPAGQQMKDSSAAAIVASALLELCRYVPDPAKQQQYWSAAMRMLDSLSSPAYLAEGTASPGILLHGVGHYPAGQEVNVSLIYGDYYFLEAVRRFLQQPTPPAPVVWYSRQGFYASLHRLGSGNTGVQSIEFDVRPLRSGIDGLVGYADSSTTVTLRSHLAMMVRMHPNGYFEVVNGASAGSVTRVYYTANTTYHVRILADVPARRYSVWVRPPGGSEILIADRYAFRADAPPTDDLGQVSTKSGSDNDFWVANHTLRPALMAALDVPPEEFPTEAGQGTSVLPALDAVERSPDAAAPGCTTAAGPGALALWGMLAWLLRTSRRLRTAKGLGRSS